MNEQFKSGADIHAGDGGYSESTKERYEAFVKVRNKSLAESRIKQLAEQVDREFDNPGARQKAIERFAELIVLECASVVNSRDDSDTGFWANIIKEHFGVE